MDFFYPIFIDLSVKVIKDRVRNSKWKVSTNLEFDKGYKKNLTKSLKTFMQESIFDQMVQKTASQHSRTPTLPPTEAFRP